MAHFYAGIDGNRGPATRMGSKSSGIRSYVQGWHSRVSVSMYDNENRDSDMATIVIGAHGGGSPAFWATDIDTDALVAHRGDDRVSAAIRRAEDALRAASDIAADIAAEQLASK